MIDFTVIQIDEIQDIIEKARRDNKISYQEISDEFGFTSRASAKNKETNILKGSTEGFLSYIKAIGGVLYFEPDSSRTDMPFVLRTIQDYKSGKIDAGTAGRKIVSRLSTKK